MADKKISQLTAATTPLAGTEVLPIVQNSNTVKVAVSNLTDGLSTVPVTKGGTGLTTLATGRIPYGNATGALSSSSALAFDGTNLNLTNGLNTAFMYASGEVRVGSGWALAWGPSGNYKVNITGNLSTNVMTFVTDGTLRQTIGATGDITNHTGNFVVGTSGKGIDFSATSDGSGTMTSELLADYEEGTWTPTQGAGLTVVGTFSSTGTYTKVGRMVTVRGTLTGTTSVACAAGSILTAGLPYNPISVSTGGAINDNLNGSSVSYVSPAGPSIYVHSAIAAAGTIGFSAIYFV